VIARIHSTRRAQPAGQLEPNIDLFDAIEYARFIFRGLIDSPTSRPRRPKTQQADSSRTPIRTASGCSVVTTRSWTPNPHAALFDAIRAGDSSLTARRSRCATACACLSSTGCWNATGEVMESSRRRGSIEFALQISSVSCRVNDEETNWNMTKIFERKTAGTRESRATASQNFTLLPCGRRRSIRIRPHIPKLPQEPADRTGGQQLQRARQSPCSQSR